MGKNERIGLNKQLIFLGFLRLGAYTFILNLNIN